MSKCICVHVYNIFTTNADHVCKNNKGCRMHYSDAMTIFNYAFVDVFLHNIYVEGLWFVRVSIVFAEKKSLPHNDLFNIRYLRFSPQHLCLRLFRP